MTLAGVRASQEARKSLAARKQTQIPGQLRIDVYATI